MNFAKCAVLSIGLVLGASAAVLADDVDPTAHDLAAQCAARNGTFDASTKECHEPGTDSAAGDLFIGPMMRVVAPTTDDATDGQ